MATMASTEIAIPPSSLKYLNVCDFITTFVHNGSGLSKVKDETTFWYNPAEG